MFDVIATASVGGNPELMYGDKESTHSPYCILTTASFHCHYLRKLSPIKNTKFGTSKTKKKNTINKTAQLI